MKVGIVIGALAMCVVIGGSRAAEAAPAPVCYPASVLPNAVTIPANLPAFGYTAVNAKATDIKLVVQGTQTQVPLTLGPAANGLLKVAPVAALTPGTAYELQYEAFCAYGGFPNAGPLKFTATAAAPLPTKIGDAVSAPSVVVKDFGTSQFTITATYTLAAEMKPWTSAYQFVIDIDGRVVETKVTPSATDIQVVATGWCDETNAATPSHAIKLQGRLPFTTTLETAVAQVPFACPALSVSRPGNANPTRPTGGGDGGEPSTSSSGGSSGGSSGASHGTSTCTSAAVGSGETSPPLFALGLLGLVALVRKSQRRTVGGK